MKKQRKLIMILLIPLLCLVFVQGMLPFMMLVGSDIKNSLTENTVRVDSHIVENRQVVLQNEMIERWRSIYKISDALSDQLTEVLTAEKTDMEDFLKDTKLQQDYLGGVFQNMINELQYNTASGVFLVLANAQSIETEGDYQGFWVRDSDPLNAGKSYEDLLLERGSKQLSQNESISLDSAWSTRFQLKGAGERSADDFFYKPYLAAMANKDTEMVNLGYWAQPFILEDHYMDNHQMITYSVPLKLGQTVYGVLGVEIGTSYLNSYFPIKDLDSKLNDGYAVMLRQKKGIYCCLTGKGNLYDTVSRNSESINVEKVKQEDLYKVQGAKIGKQNIYAVIKPLNLYNSNVPYEDTQWVLCGMVTEQSIYGLGNSVYLRMLTVILGGLCFAALAAFLLIRYITKPIYRLVESVQGGVEGIHQFQKSHIEEIDELHTVIERLTDAQKKTQDQLMEEKERYRVSVESSKDLFFTYRCREKTLQIVNSNGRDGEWDCMAHPEFIDNTCVHPEDREQLFQTVHNAQGSINLEFRLRATEYDPYRWVNLYGTALPDANGQYSRLVGCIHDIHQHKILEEEKRNKEIYDPVTSFYRLSCGIEQMQAAQKEEGHGMLLLLDICGFSKINGKYGMIMGDILVKHLAKLVQKFCEKEHSGHAVYIRVGADRLLVWLSGIEETGICAALEKIRKAFVGLTDEQYLELDFCCGMTRTSDIDPVDQQIEQVKKALSAAKQKNKRTVIYQTLTQEERKSLPAVSFEEIDSYERLNRMSLGSIAMNLFDRGGEISVILDMLAIRLHQDYGLKNLVITGFNREYYSNSLFYSWHTDPIQQKEVIRCTQEEYRSYIQPKKLQEVRPVEGKTMQDPTLHPFLGEHDGLAYHMSDNGSYSGSILLIGMDEKYFRDEANRKQLDEIAGIVQNRINLNRHDLSAQAKSDFLARMSHEIRTPMNGIMGMTQIALKEGQSDARRIDCLQKIESSSVFLLGILNDVLDMSKIESGKMKLVYGTCDMPAMLHKMEDMLEFKIREKKIHYTHAINLQHTLFYCDELRINQVLVNLLGNAIKFTNPQGHVQLSVTEQALENNQSALTFSVRDDGIGIAPDKQQLIFQRFEQGDDLRQERQQGTGLGLAISSHLVHMMNGDIALESALNEGSTFSFTIQLKTLDIGKASTSNIEKETDFTGKRVLVVEDNALNMEIAEEMLQTHGLLVEKAYDGTEAVERMREIPEGYYDLILMDIRMPVMDGLEAARQIRQMKRTDCRTVPIVAMSANAFEEDVKNSLASGMNAHISKPVNIQKIIAVLREVL